MWPMGNAPAPGGLLHVEDVDALESLFLQVPDPLGQPGDGRGGDRHPHLLPPVKGEDLRDVPLHERERPLARGGAPHGIVCFPDAVAAQDDAEPFRAAECRQFLGEEGAVGGDGKGYLLAAGGGPFPGMGDGFADGVGLQERFAAEEGASTCPPWPDTFSSRSQSTARPAMSGDMTNRFFLPSKQYAQAMLQSLVSARVMEVTNMNAFLLRRRYRTIFLLRIFRAFTT